MSQPCSGTWLHSSAFLAILEGEDMRDELDGIPNWLEDDPFVKRLNMTPEEVSSRFHSREEAIAYLFVEA